MRYVGGNLAELETKMLRVLFLPRPGRVGRILLQLSVHDLTLQLLMRRLNTNQTKYPVFTNVGIS